MAESEAQRKMLQERLRVVYGDWEERLKTIAEEKAHIHNDKIKVLEGLNTDLVKRVDTLESTVNALRSENENLKKEQRKYSDEDDEDESPAESAALRRQIDNLLKEKTALSQENHELRQKLTSTSMHTIPEPQQDSSGKKNRPQQSDRNKDKTVEKSREFPREQSDRLIAGESIQSSRAADNLALDQEDIELRNRVLTYFQRRHPEAEVVQVNKSRLYCNKDTFTVEGQRVTFRISNGNLSVKAGGGFLPVNQYFALHPLDKPSDKVRKSVGGQDVSPPPGMTASRSGGRIGIGSSRSPAPNTGRKR